MHVVLNMLIFTRTLVTFARTTFKPRWCLNFQSVCARKRSLLTLHITCLDRSRWKYYGTVVNILSFLEMGWQTKNDKWPVCCCACWVHQLLVSPYTSHPMLQIRSKLLHGNSTSSLNSSYIWLASTLSLKSTQQLSSQPLEQGCKWDQPGPPSAKWHYW